jgi:hypothetical protein
MYKNQFFINRRLKYEKVYTSEDLNPHPPRGSSYKCGTGNLLENSSAMRIEFFKGVNDDLVKIKR